jgi:hypothetical protein
MQNAECRMQSAESRSQRATSKISTPASVLCFCILISAFCIVYGVAFAQQPLDRVLVRIGTTPITLSDVKAAVGLGLVAASSPDDPAALTQVVDRQLMLMEVTRFPPAEPAAAAIDQQLNAMRKHAGSALPDLLASTGVDEAGLRELARDTLRIQAYISQRFGNASIVSEDDARRYYDEHIAQFTRSGKPIPFENAEAEARRLASTAKLQESIAQWVRDLRMRAEVVEVRTK